jgi:hypothetical protein
MQLKRIVSLAKMGLISMELPVWLAQITARPAQKLNSRALHARTISSLWVGSAFVMVLQIRLAGALRVQLLCFTTVLKMFASLARKTVLFVPMKQVAEVVLHHIFY